MNTDRDTYTTHRGTWSLPAVLVASLFFFCAHQIPPSGGPDDTIPPRVVSTRPGFGATAVPPGGDIVVTFSEWIDPATAHKAVSVYPPLSGAMRVSVRGKRLVISSRKPLRDSTTYHLLLSDALRDLHRVKLDDPVNLIFSTGPSLDSGSLRGCIADMPKRRLPTAALYMHGDSFSDTALFDVPSYAAQADTNGLFSFDFVRPGRYRLIAFVDKNYDGRFQPGDETLFLPRRKIIRITEEKTPVTLYRADADTNALRCSGIVARAPGILIGSWNRPSFITQTHLRATMRVEPLADTIPAVSIDRFVPLGTATRFALFLTDPLVQTGYRFICGVFSACAPDTAPLTHDTLRFNATTVADTVPPRLASRYPRSRAPLRPQVRLVWSEPVRCIPGALTFTDTLGDSVVFSCDTGYADTTILTPRASLLPGRTYRCSLETADFIDLSGNRLSPPDSTTPHPAFSTIDPSNIALSLSGRASCSLPPGDVTWFFAPLSTFGSERFTAPDRGGRFRFDSIAAGEGRMGFFVDDNGDGRHTPGRLVPWLAPEAMVTGTDTLEARARWDVNGVVFEQCDPCGDQD